MFEILRNLLTAICTLYLGVDVFEYFYGKFKSKLVDAKEKTGSIPSNPINDVKEELRLVEQILKGTANLEIAYDRHAGQFIADLTAIDPLDGNTYHFQSTESGVQKAINDVVMQYVHLLESQERPYLH